MDRLTTTLDICFFWLWVVKERCRERQSDRWEGNCERSHRSILFLFGHVVFKEIDGSKKAQIEEKKKKPFSSLLFSFFLSVYCFLMLAPCVVYRQTDSHGCYIAMHAIACVHHHHHVYMITFIISYHIWTRHAGRSGVILYYNNIINIYK